MNKTKDLMSTFVNFVAQIHIFHWQSKKYAEHVALGSLYDGIQDLSDDFMEVFIGNNDGARAGSEDMIPGLFSLDVSSVGEVIFSFESFLKNMDVESTDLLNIRDEMLALVHKTQYLLTLS